MSLAALLWAAVLLQSVLASLRGMPESMLRAMRDLFLPSGLMRPAAAWAHLVLQIILIGLLIFASRPVSWFSGAIGMLLAFTYLVLVARARGSECRCLSTKPQPITNITVLRNVFVLALAILSVGADGITGVSWSQWPALIPLAGVIACEAASRSVRRA